MDMKQREIEMQIEYEGSVLYALCDLLQCGMGDAQAVAEAAYTDGEYLKFRSQGLDPMQVAKMVEEKSRK